MRGTEMKVAAETIQTGKAQLATVFSGIENMAKP